MVDHLKRNELFSAIYHANSKRSLHRAINLLEGHPGLHLLFDVFPGCGRRVAPD
jgi:hypothetical protein